MSAISLSSTSRTRESVRSEAVGTTQKRWLALDLLRFLAVAMMVQGHTFTALLDDGLRHSTWFRYHDYIHGYTAPLFMFSAGLAFGVTTLRAWAKQSHWGRATRKRIFRYILIIAIGYALQLPGGSLQPLLHGGSDGMWQRLWAVNALQVIGVTLLGCQLLALAVRRRGTFVAISAAVGTFVVVAAPYVWDMPVAQHLPSFFAAYFNDQTGSLFPALPWSGFIFAGIVTAWLVGDVSEAERRVKLAPTLALAGGAIATAAVLLDQSGFHLVADHDFWQTCPYFFLWRIGGILPVLGAFGVFEQWHARARAGVPDGPLLHTARVMGQESLVVYVGHLVLIYGFMLPWGMTSSWSHSLTLGPAIVAVTVLFALMIVLARYWHHVKMERPSRFDTMRYTLGFATVAMLFIRG